MTIQFPTNVKSIIETRQALEAARQVLNELSDRVDSLEGGVGPDTHPVVDSTSLVRDVLDESKQVRIDAGAVSSGWVRVIEMADADVDLAALLAHLSDTDNPHETAAYSSEDFLADLALASVDGHSDVDTTTDTPELNEVLKWDGSNWVPGTAGDTTEFTFSIDSFSDGISDTLQLIGSGEWQAIGGITFTATYSNPPAGMTAEVAMSGSATPWSGNLDMDPVTGPENNTEAVDYPSSPTGTITFTLSQSADASTAQDSVSFSNTVRYGNSTLTQGNQTEASLEALTERSGPDESRIGIFSNIPTTSDYLVFAYPDRLSDVVQVRRASGGLSYVTAAFNTDRTVATATIQSGVADVTNSAGYTEDFACITSKDTGLADGANDFQLTASSTPQNYIRGGGNTESTPGSYTESDIETGLTDDYVQATNDHTQTWPTVTLAASEHYVFAMPSRLSTPTFYDNDTGFEASFQSPATLSITNDAGFQEDYKIFVSTNPLGPGDFTLRTE